MCVCVCVCMWILLAAHLLDVARAEPVERTVLSWHCVCVCVCVCVSVQDKNSPDGLEGVERRWVKFGGGVSAAQIDWLRGELQVGVCVCVCVCVGVCVGGHQH